jgi:hypothetical protein
VVRYLLDTPIRSVARVPTLALVVVAAFLLYRVTDAPPRLRDALTAGWMVVGFPLAVLALRGRNHGFWSVWAILAVVAVSVANSGPLRRAPSPAATVACGMVLAAICAQGLRWAGSHVVGIDRAAYAQAASPWRQLEMRIGDLVLSRPDGERYAVLFDERSILVANFMFYERSATRPHVDVALVHSSYYRGLYGARSADQVVPRLVSKLEAQVGTLAFGHCDPAAALQLPDIAAERQAEPGGKSLAGEVLVALNGHVLDSPRWRVIDRLEVPGTCVYAYELAEGPLSAEEKWRLAPKNARPTPD